MPSRGLRVATLNCLNLALPARRFYPGVLPYSADEYLAKTQWLAQMIDRLAADFVLVQEVFHAQALSDVMRQTAAGAAAYRSDVPLAGDNNDKPRLGLIWRASWHPQLDSIVALPPGCAVAVPEQPDHTAFSRPLLRVRIPLDAGLATPQQTTLTILNVHLKSRRPEYAAGESEDDPAAEARAQLRALIKRGAEAAAVRRIVVEATRGSRAPLIVAGDFNDEANAVTTRMVADTSWRHEGLPPRDCSLFNAFDVERRLAPGGGRHTAFSILHAGEPEHIDHVFVSEEFVPSSRHAIGHVAAVEVLNDHLLERRRRAVAGSAVGADLERIYSDHAAVCVALNFDHAA